MIVFCLSTREKDVDKSRLLVERAKLAKHVVVFAGVCYGGKEDRISF